jgi:hypothetical protein
VIGEEYSSDAVVVTRAAAGPGMEVNRLIGV